MIPITRDLLTDLAGWSAIKQARILQAAGSVIRATLTNPEDAPAVCKGLVLEGRKKHPCGLVIRSATDADNLCTCAAARRDGQICAHSIAAVLQALADQERAHAPADHFSASATPPEQAEAASASPITSDVPTRVPLHVARHPSKAHTAVLTRPAIAGHQFIRARGNVLLEPSDSSAAIPTNFTSTSKAFQSAIAPLLEDSATESTLELDQNWLRANADHLGCMFHVECLDDLIDSLRVLPGTPVIHLALEGSLNRIDLKLTFKYPPGTARNPSVEQAAQARLTHAQIHSLAHSVPDPPTVKQTAESTGPETKLIAFIRGENAILDFYAGALDQILAESEWHVEIGERFASLTRDIEKVRPRVETVSSGTDWLSFDLQFTADAAGESIPEAEIRRLLQTGQSRTQLPSGRRAAIDRSAIGDLYQSLEDVAADQGADGHSTRIVKSAQKFYIEEAVKVFAHDAGKSQNKPTPATPGLEVDLRPYQINGLSWLFERISSHHGAILADEMGLGKTVQTLALIAALNPGRGGRPRPAADAPAQTSPKVTRQPPPEESPAPVLIVAPTSLISTWQREAKKFLPRAHVLVLHGPSRHRYFEVIASADIVLTSYGALVRDIARYPPAEFALAVADEASYLKNPRTKNAKAACKIKARARLALTGTPVENTIQDVWSIMQFANPGYLGHREEFLARYSADDPATNRNLRRRLNPFLLRRLKAQVATDLPEKIERVIYCELSPAQRKTYQTLLNEGRKKLSNLNSASKWQENRMDVLTLLLRLRQTCCDLRLLNLQQQQQPSASQPSHSVSAKFGALDTLLREAIPAGHRVLIFSQFVSMLALVREHLDTQDLRYAYLDGSTAADERAAQVDAFQAPDSALPIFLISLKAGGYGLTLTAADTVIHLDPWWNPAVEAQATDRAHRIGQSNPVTAYKFITTGTVEEKILQLQNRKRDLIDATLDDHRPLMTALSQEDIEYVLS